VEAGIRSGDWTMPEEINRLVTDSITNYFFTTTLEAGENLKKSGIPNTSIFWVGNTMIDTLVKHRSRFQKPKIWDELKLSKKGYIVMTLHRPGNVDEEEKLKSLMSEIVENSNNLPLIFPVHPRTAKILNGLGIQHNRLHTIDPLGYLEFNYLVENSLAVITDSGGITEETTVMGIPCMTLRNNTERPETVKIGSNELIGTDPRAIKPAMEKLFSGNWKKGKSPKLWDGQAANRIVNILNELFKENPELKKKIMEFHAISFLMGNRDLHVNNIMIIEDKNKQLSCAPIDFGLSGHNFGATITSWSVEIFTRFDASFLNLNVLHA